MPKFGYGYIFPIPMFFVSCLFSVRVKLRSMIIFLPNIHVVYVAFVMASKGLCRACVCGCSAERQHLCLFVSSFYLVFAAKCAIVFV